MHVQKETVSGSSVWHKVLLARLHPHELCALHSMYMDYNCVDKFQIQSFLKFRTIKSSCWWALCNCDPSSPYMIIKEQLYIRCLSGGENVHKASRQIHCLKLWSFPMVMDPLRPIKMARQWRSPSYSTIREEGPSGVQETTYWSSR